MWTVLLVIILITGVIFAITVSLMNPKWGLGVIAWWLGWGGDEYGSKKSIEWTLKKTALVTGIIFAIVCFVYPYVA